MAVGAAEQLADGRARRPRAGDALGAGLAAGDRPRAVRPAGDEVRRDGRVDGRDPGAGRRGAGACAARRTPARRSSTSRSTSCSSEARRAGARARRCPTRPPARSPTATRSTARVALLREAERPVIMAGTNLYWGARRGRAARARRGARHPGVPQRPRARLRARRPRARSSRARARRRSRAPTSRSSSACRWTSASASAQSFGEETEIVAIDRAEPSREHPRPVAAELYGGVAGILDALRDGARRRPRDTRAWVAQAARGRGREARGRARRELADDRAPLHPMRLYGELAEVLDRDAIVDRRRRRLRLLRRPRHRLLRAGLLAGPGPVRLPGLRARATRWPRSSRTPSARSCCCSATARSASAGMEFDTLARHGVNVVGVMGNNGIWALEKHPMEFLYGYSVAAELRPGDALRRGGRGARRARRVRARGPRSCGPRSSARSRPGEPALVNVLTDPAVAYPRAVEPGLRGLSKDGSRPRRGGFQIGPDRTGRGTCHAGAGFDGSDGGRRRFDAASPEPMSRRRDHHAFRHDHPFASEVSLCPSGARQQSNIRPDGQQKWRPT